MKPENREEMQKQDNTPEDNLKTGGQGKGTEMDTLRERIDAIDDRIIADFTERMKTVVEIAKYKSDAGLSIYDGARERSKLNYVAENTPEDLQSYTRVLFSLLFELSRSYQHMLINPSSELKERIEETLRSTHPMFPQKATVACQGLEGAYSQLAAEKLFKFPSIIYFNNFEGVFSAIEKGFCSYGVLPIENSTAGSVYSVYDLMAKHNFNIVRSVRLKVDHSLLVKPGTELGDIKEVYSHEQAINQCEGFLKSLASVKVNVCENTAAAAKLVAESDRKDVAALSSGSCAPIYGLKSLKSSVQDKGNNYTRFICISKEPQIYAGADRTSLMISIAHKPGSLYKVLSRFFALGINLTKLESRPIPDRDFEFMFYFDLEASVYSPEFARLIVELEGLCDDFQYLGSYSEIV
jgi:chorismate mutase/prephenate dehydratase